MKRLTVCFAFLIGLSFAFTASAEMYKWVDGNGVVHFSDEMPSKTSSNIETLQTYNRTFHQENESDSVDDQYNEDESAISPLDSTKYKIDTTDTGTTVDYSSAEVELYTTSWCHYCKKAKEFLESEGVTYTEYDVEKDKEAAKRKAELGGGRGVPFAVINGQKIYGFSKSSYERALAQ